MNEKRIAAVWRVTKELAESLKWHRDHGFIVLEDGNEMIAEIVIKESPRFLGLREGRCTVVLFDEREDGFGYFETIKEAREYFAKRFSVAKPVKWQRAKA